MGRAGGGMTDHQLGATLYTTGQPAKRCTNEDQLRGWLDAANLAWWKQSHAVNARWTPRPMGKRLLCTGSVDQETRQVVIIPALREVDGLAVLPGEDPAWLIADREAILDEVERRPNMECEQ